MAAWGAVDFPFKTHSILKSLHSLVFGVAHDDGRLDRSLAGLGIDDLQPLTGAEKEATVADLMASRSGVYHPAAYETESNAARRPERGTAAHGTSWYYNNWDFNVLPEVFRRGTGQPLERVVSRDWVERSTRPTTVFPPDTSRAAATASA